MPGLRQSSLPPWLHHEPCKHSLSHITGLSWRAQSWTESSRVSTYSPMEEPWELTSFVPCVQALGKIKQFSPRLL